ncbi:alanyl-tRNA editing protein [Rosenbergiella nectarea]|uniref:alanyl-tRNA editing protein n=1 Tax=Rosenbergiella nectarea TaxID=988801 RepID=UPI001F4D9DEE|nr:alanyl-tRNA editing protein [Rosenbergiella nectarea]
MNKTSALYYKDAYLNQVDTQISCVCRDESGLPYCLLNETVFYPQGGGQLGDRGYLMLSASHTLPQRVKVATTKRQGDEIRHYLDIDDSEFSYLQELASQDVTAVLDWSRRYHQMRIHSAVHLIHCVLEEVSEHPISYPVRSPLSDDNGENHYLLLDDIDEDVLNRVTIKLNAFCTTGHDIHTEPDAERGNGFRLWKCGKWVIPCGGTHIKNTREMGTIFSTLKVKKNTTRITLWLADESG